MKNKLRTMMPLLFVIAAAASMVLCAFAVYRNSRVLSDMSATIRSLSAEKTTVEASSVSSNMSLLKKDANVDGYRVRTDNEIISSFLGEIMDWSSYDGYTAIRERTMKQYGLTEDDSFVKTFLPVVLNQDDGTGVKRNIIDDGSSRHPGGLRLNFEDTTPYVTAVNGDVYSYMNVVTVSSPGAYDTNATVTAAFLCDVDADGNLSNLGGSLMSQQ